MLKVNKIMISFVLIATVSLYFCHKTDNEVQENLVTTSDFVDIDPNPYTLLCVLQSITFGTIPAFLKVYKAPELLESKNAIANVAIVDLSKGASFQKLGDANGYKTPIDSYVASKKKIILMNGGYLWKAVR